MTDSNKNNNATKHENTLAGLQSKIKVSGSLQLKRGIWHAVLSYKNDNCEHKHKWISTGLAERGNKKVAKEILEQEIKKFEEKQLEAKSKLERRYSGKTVDKSKSFMLFSDYCLLYLKENKSKISPAVYTSYELNQKRIKSYFDKEKLRLIDVTDEEISAFYDNLRKQGLKEVSIKHFECIICPALKQGYRDKHIPDNPYDFVPSISREKPILNYYNESEMAKLFEVIKGNKFELMIKMLGCYGLRRSELIGLKWSAIDFIHKTLAINHKIIVCKAEVIATDILKTESSRRTLPLIPEISQLLKKKKVEMEANRKFYGNTYNVKYNDYVFVEENGKLIYPDAITKNFAKILKRNTLKHIRLHDMRHSCASILLANNVNIKNIQEWLGHSNFLTTANTYSHLDYSSKLESANAISHLFELKNNEKKQQDERDVAKKMLMEMFELGFNNVDDYFTYLESKNRVTESKSKDNPKGDYSM